MGSGLDGTRSVGLLRCGRWLRLWGILPPSRKWPPSLVTISIQVKELIPVVLAAAIYERSWQMKVVLSGGRGGPVQPGGTLNAPCEASCLLCLSLWLLVHH